MKKKTPQQELKELSGNLVDDINRWNHLNEYGGSDPFWTDGVNMNLVRNHVIYHKQQIKEICEENSLAFPDTYYLATPPKVDDGYMANVKQRDRIKRLRQFGTKITIKRVEYDASQISLF
ncbi:MAG: hypothetical protein LUC95_12750 [Lachnospiraceae bacterium]|nr:hypothetical protein [Lachnospiraceae bacterium]